MGAVFLDVSKCYEGVTHEMAGTRALESGCHPVVTNLVVNMHQGRRRRLVDGAVSAPLKGSSGFMAWCSVARDFLKAFLLPLTSGGLRTQITDYVDDIVVLQFAKEVRWSVITLSKTGVQRMDWT